MLLAVDYGAGEIAGVCLLAAIVGLVLKKLFFGGKKQHKDLQKGQREILDEYPDPPPAKEGGRRLVFDGVDVRLRFVAIAPTGTQHAAIDVDEVSEILDGLLRGLGTFLKSDKPRVKVWPAQLSVPGFAPSFFRLVESPDDAGKKSHWIRTAGPIKIGGRPYLLGLAFYSDEANKLGNIPLDATEWSEHLQIEK